MQKIQQKLNEFNAIINRTDRLYMRFAKICGINHYTIQILYLLYHMNVRTQKDIVDLFGLPKQTVNTIVNQLVAKDYISFSIDTKDKRGKIISFTPSGKEYAEKLTTPLWQCETNVLQKMGDEKAFLLIQCIQEYAYHLEQEINKFQKATE